MRTSGWGRARTYSDGTPESQWYSNHLPLPNPLLEASRREAVNEVLPIYIRSCQILEYAADLSSIESDVFYVPQLALHSFTLQDGYLYIFQFTIGGKHDIKPGLVDLAEVLVVSHRETSGVLCSYPTHD